MQSKMIALYYDCKLDLVPLLTLSDRIGTFIYVDNNSTENCDTFVNLMTNLLDFEVVSTKATVIAFKRGETTLKYYKALEYVDSTSTSLIICGSNPPATVLSYLAPTFDLYLDYNTRYFIDTMNKHTVFSEEVIEQFKERVSSTWVMRSADTLPSYYNIEHRLTVMNTSSQHRPSVSRVADLETCMYVFDEDLVV
jgi:hypothetical protein